MGVGKTSFLKRLITEEALRRPAPTVGIEYVNKVFEMKNGGKLMTQIWDTAGQEKYKSICTHHYKNAIGALVVFDLTRKKTFDNCVNWVADFLEKAHPKARIVMVGNKLDIVETDSLMRRVDKKEAEKWAEENMVTYMEVSTMKNVNVYEAIENLMDEVYNTVNSFNPNESKGFMLNLSTTMEKKAEKDECC